MAAAVNARKIKKIINVCKDFIEQFQSTICRHQVVEFFGEMRKSAELLMNGLSYIIFFLRRMD